jgi:hypothetical protein
MRRHILLPGFLLLAMAFSGCASTDSAVAGATRALAGESTSLLGLLTDSLGVTQNQAEGGVGSMLKLAQEKLAAGDFDRIAAAIPGAQKYLDKAKSLNAFAGNIGNLAGLNGAFGKLGISPATAAKFVPTVTDFVSKVGGADVGNLLKGALG